MKQHLTRSLSLILSLMLICTFFVPLAAAKEPFAEESVHRSVIYYSDGSRDEITLELMPQGKERSTITASKNREHYTSSDVLVWRVKLTATFTYNGTSSSCTNAYTTVNFYESGWSTVTNTTNYSGNTATNTVVLAKKILGITVPMANVNLSLSCDKNGNLS